jgi:hypothetical protein
MQRTPVTSSLVKSVGYDPDLQILEVEFCGNSEEPKIYRYTNVGKLQYDAMIDPANSAGRIINAMKRDATITCERVESEAA